MNIRAMRRRVMMLGMLGLLVGGAACSRRPATAWYTDLEEGLVAARLLKKDALIFFSCSTWPGRPGELSREVLTDTTLQAQAADACVLINLDIPQVLAPSATMSQGDIDKIRKVIGVFRLTTMPVFYLTDSNGLPFSRETFHPGGSAAFLKTYERMLLQKKEIAALYQDARSLRGAARARKLNEAVERMPTDSLVFHRAYVSEIIALDANNQAGLRNKYMARFMLFEAGDELERKNPDAALNVLDRIYSQLSPTGDLRQAMFFLQSRAFSAKQNSMGVLDALTRAREAAPHTELAGTIERMLAERTPSKPLAPMDLLSPMPHRLPAAGPTPPPGTGVPPPTIP